MQPRLPQRSRVSVQHRTRLIKSIEADGKVVQILAQLHAHKITSTEDKLIYQRSLARRCESREKRYLARQQCPFHLQQHLLKTNQVFS